MKKSGKKKQSVSYAKVRIQKRQKARNIRQLIDRIDYDKGAAISDSHIRKDAFSASKGIKALDADGLALVKAGQYDYLPTAYEQGARLGRHHQRPTDKNTALQAGFNRSVDEAIMFLCSVIASRHPTNSAITARDIYRRRRRIAQSYLVRERGWLLALAQEYLHASEKDAEQRIRDCLRAVADAMPPVAR